MIAITMEYGLNLHHLELFHLVASSGSMTGGAEQAFTSQPSLSKQMKTFEESLGVRLMDRLPRGIRLTDAGELLASHARGIFAARDRAVLELDEFVGKKRGRLDFASSRTIGSYLLPRLLAAYMEEWPGIGISARVANTGSCVESVSKNEVEFALVEGPVDRDDLTVIPFGDDSLEVVAAPDHPLSRRRKPIDLDRLVREPLISRERGSGTREILDRELSRSGARWEPHLELESTEAIKGLVAAGVGVAVLSGLAVARELEAGTLVRITVRSVVFARRLSLVRSTLRTPSPAYLAFEPHLFSRVRASATPRRRA